MDHLPTEWVKMSPICFELDIRQHAGQDFEPEIFFVSQPISSALNDSDFVVQTFDKSTIGAADKIIWFYGNTGGVPQMWGV